MWHNTYTVSFLSHIAGDRQLVRFEGLTGAAVGNDIERGFSRKTLRGIFKGEQRSKCLHSWDAFAVPLHNFLKEFIYLFRQRGREGRERGRETSMCGCLSHGPHWGLGPQPRHVP